MSSSASKSSPPLNRELANALRDHWFNGTHCITFQQFICGNPTATEDDAKKPCIHSIHGITPEYVASIYGRDMAAPSIKKRPDLKFEKGTTDYRTYLSHVAAVVFPLYFRKYTAVFGFKPLFTLWNIPFLSFASFGHFALLDPASNAFFSTPKKPSLISKQLFATASILFRLPELANLNIEDRSFLLIMCNFGNLESTRFSPDVLAQMQRAFNSEPSAIKAIYPEIPGSIQFLLDNPIDSDTLVKIANDAQASNTPWRFLLNALSLTLQVSTALLLPLWMPKLLLANICLFFVVYNAAIYLATNIFINMKNSGLNQLQEDLKFIKF